MKKFLIAFALLFSLTGFSQALTDGSYWSNITVHTSGGEKTYGYEFIVKNGQVSQKDINPAVATTKSHGNQTVHTWINQGGIWTESQTFIFTKDVISGNIYVYFFRAVQNEGKEPWFGLGAGVVNKD